MGKDPLKSWRKIVPDSGELFSINHDNWMDIGLPHGVYVCLSHGNSMITTKDEDGATISIAYAQFPDHCTRILRYGPEQRFGICAECGRRCEYLHYLCEYCR